MSPRIQDDLQAVANNPLGRVLTLENLAMLLVFTFGVGGAWYAVGQEASQALQKATAVDSKLEVVANNQGELQSQMAAITADMTATHDKIDTMREDTNRQLDQMNSKLDALLQQALKNRD